MAVGTHASLITALYPDLAGLRYANAKFCSICLTQGSHLAIHFVGGLFDASLTINCSSFIFYAVAALFGPIMIPLYMTETFRGKFLHFVEVLASLAMIRAVAAAFIFVWSQFLIGFMNQTFQSNYSIANWVANLVPFLTIFIAFILNMVLVHRITQMIFGGGASAAGKIGELAEKAAMYS